MTKTNASQNTRTDFAVFEHGRQHPRSMEPPALVSETQRLKMLNETSTALSSQLDLRDVYDTIYEQISRVMDTSMFFLALPHHEHDRASIPYLREHGELSLNVTTPAGRSVTTHVFELGQPLLFHTTEQYERYALSHGLPVIVLGDESRGAAESMIFAPLNTGSKTIGTLSTQSTRQYAYSQDDFDTLTVIAAQAAVAVQNGHLYQASVEAARRRQVLLRVAESVNSSLELSAVVSAVLDGINDVMPFHLASILLPNHKLKRLELVGAVGGITVERQKELKIDFGTGVTGKVFETGQPLVIPDVREFDGYVSGSDEVLSEVAVPLKQRNAIVGVLNVDRSEINAFADEDIQLLSLFATQAAIAIENARLFEDQRNRVLELQTIQGIVREMTSLHENDAIASAVERGLHRLIDFEACIIYVVNESSGLLEPILAATGRDGPKRLSKVPRRPRSLGEGISGWVWQHAESTIFESTRTDPRVSDDVRASGIDMSVMASPLMHHGRVSGVITVGTPGVASYDENALRVLEIIANHAAIGFDRCRLYDELQLQATTDDLTGLFNRRHLARRLSEEKSRARRNGHPLAVLMLDADNFKSINDDYGHDAGDDVLRGLANLLRNELRTEDIVARYGGEEFLILLPEVDLGGATVVAERLCRVIAGSQLALDPQVHHIEVSVGVGALEDSDAGEELITRADLAMYEAKKNGGNGVCFCQGGVYTLAVASSIDDSSANLDFSARERRTAGLKAESARPAWGNLV